MARKKTKVIEVDEYQLRLYTFFGQFKVYSEIPMTRFVTDLHNAVINTDPDFSGWFKFEKLDGNNISLNLRDIRGVEEIPDEDAE